MKQLIVAVASLALLVARSAPADQVGREAGQHFQRGVDLYGDGDFRGALVEFKRAYGLLPRASVLYNIGETQFQLQDYAGALTTMRRFLTETGPSAPHRTEVEATVETLTGRVGKIAISTDGVRCEVSIDDQAVGPTPVAEPVLVSIGPRRVAVACPDRPIAIRRVEVAAGELVRVDVPLGPSLTPPSPVLAATRPAPRASASHPRAGLALSWTSTALLAAATIGTGTAALVESSQLGRLRETYPATVAQLDQKAALTRGLSIAADTLGLAALVALGVSTYVTVKQHRERKLVVGFGPGTATLSGTF